MADLPVRTQIIRPDQIARVDLGLLDKLVNVDRARRLQRELVKLLLGDLNEGLLVERIAFDDVLVGHLFAGIGIHLHIFDAMAGLPVELIEGDLIAF